MTNDFIIKIHSIFFGYDIRTRDAIFKYNKHRHFRLGLSLLNTKSYAGKKQAQTQRTCTTMNWTDDELFLVLSSIFGVVFDVVAVAVVIWFFSLWILLKLRPCQPSTITILSNCINIYSCHNANTVCCCYLRYW